jgi:hypothetical protein
MKVEYIICISVFILVVIVIIITLTKNKFTNTKTEKFADDPLPSTKTLKYFGGGYCPYSNTNSNAYNVILDFENLKKDVKVEYYWTENNQDKMEQYEIMYVPTILGKDDKPIELKLPDNFDKTGKTDAEIKTALMEHIYSLV